MWQHCHKSVCAFHSSIHQFSEYGLNTYCVSGTIGGSGDKMVTSGTECVSPLDLTVWALRQKSVTRPIGRWRKIRARTCVRGACFRLRPLVQEEGKAMQLCKRKELLQMRRVKAERVFLFTEPRGQKQDVLFPTFQEGFGLPDIQSSPSLNQLLSNQPIPLWWK